MVVSIRHSANVCCAAGVRLRIRLAFAPSEGERMNQWRAEMNRQQSGAHQQAYPDFGQDRGIGLRAVAAAIRYQGDASNAWRPPKSEVSAPPSVVTQTRDAEK
jgi:hypothetical protein